MSDDGFVFIDEMAEITPSQWAALGVQAHAMSHPGVVRAQVVTEDELRQMFPPHAMSHPDGVEGGVRHVSDAAWLQSTYEVNRDAMEADLSDMKCVLRTVEEWQEMEYELREAKDNYANACKLVADMHAAAMGEMCGPKRGVVEDIADLRSQLAAKTADADAWQSMAEKWQEEARKFCANAAYWREQCERLREGREDDAGTQAMDAGGMVEAASEGARVRAQTLMRAMGASVSAVALDPRLGVQQPEGEPGTVTEYWKRSGV